MTFGNFLARWAPTTVEVPDSKKKVFFILPVVGAQNNEKLDDRHICMSRYQSLCLFHSYRGNILRVPAITFTYWTFMDCCSAGF
jgi:hypothetical protein